ncbi:MAG: tetratricopeptide repeat protein [candidate division Zixibacteria bacterium]|nr:tetratricopeptide repeat protein [candidate division Zixibacteria bacterium]
MYQKVKLSKRQIKEDKFTAFMLKSKSWFVENWQFAVIGVVAAILLVTAGTYYAGSQTARQQEAGIKLARALMDYRNENSQVAIMSLSQIVEDYGGDYAAQQATFLLGKVNLKIRNYPEAIRYFEMYLSRYRDDKLIRASALAGIAACHEDQADFAEAADKYAEAFEEYPDGPMSGDCQLSALRNYLEAGDTEDARFFYESLNKDFKGTGLANTATLLFMEKNQR